MSEALLHVKVWFGYLAFVSGLLGRRRFQSLMESRRSRATESVSRSVHSWPPFIGHRFGLGDSV
jgi:hypothetical protein